MHGVSIVICTHNRSVYLRKCLTSFTHQSLMPSNVEFIIVDNKSTDDTNSVALSFKDDLPGLHCVREENVGLSFARNRGIAESKYDWVCYMDDDAKAHYNYMERLFDLMDNHTFDGFGGMFLPWYEHNRPKWLRDDFGKMTMLRKDIGPLTKGKTVAGGICAFKKSWLIKAGYFPTDIGMRGNIIGYGEETILQNRMQDAGAVIGFDPSWQIDHLVAEYKHQLSWHLKRSFGKGRDAQIIKGSLSLFQKLFLLSRGLAVAGFSMLKNVVRLRNSGYYWQNYMLDSVGYLYLMAGRVSV